MGHGEEAPGAIVANPLNYRTHPAFQRRALSAVLDEVGYVQDVIVNRRTGNLIDGHLRVALALERREATVPVVYVDLEDAEERLILATLDPIGALAGQDAEILNRLRADLTVQDEALRQLLASEEQAGFAPGPRLSERFVVPPFSVLDARQGYWQERKRQWIALGILSELGRGGQPGTSARAAPGEDPTYRQIARRRGALETSDMVQELKPRADQAVARARERVAPGGSPRPAATLGADGRTVRGDGVGKRMRGAYPTTGSAAKETKGIYESNAALANVGTGRLTYVAGNRPLEELDPVSSMILESESGTSIFDPVLCELAYRWFCPRGGHVLDPFAGGSVRGVVACYLDRDYTGIDLSAVQLEANREQAERIVPARLPQWHHGDSLDIQQLAPGRYDFLFSCPPYADLEVYSEDPRDLSTMEYRDFLVAYQVIIQRSVALLAENRFACFVVGDVRDPKGIYRNFVSDTIAAFGAAGMKLYNEAILVTAVGSLSIRVGRQFSSSRKLGKTHQNVLVFVKGDPRAAADAVGPVEVADPAEMFGDV